MCYLQKRLMEAVNYFLSLEAILFMRLWLAARPDEYARLRKVIVSP